MLRVRVIQKFHNKSDGKLLGYTIQNQDNPSEIRNVYKDDLKRAVLSGQCEVVNMTLTSDGRLIGKASKAPTPRNPKVTLAIKELYNTGKEIIGGEIVDLKTNESRYFIRNDILAFIDKGILERTGEEKKRTFKSVYNKALAKVQESLSEPIGVVVTKFEKGLYTVDYTSDWYNKADPSIMALFAMCVEYSMKVAKIKVVSVDSATGKVTVNSLTGINDVRKALKDAGLNKL